MNKKDGWRYYKSWMKERTYCKALDQEIYITRKGWDHIIWGNRRRRNSRDVRVRLALLKPAKHLIKNGKGFNTEKRNQYIYFVLESKPKSKYKVKVILRKNKDGKIILFSVMKTK